MTFRSPKANAVLVQALGSGIRSTGNGLADLPALLRRVMEEDAWRAFITPRGKLIEHDRFIDFVTTPPTAGLGATMELMRKIVADDPVACDLLDQAVQQPMGANQHRKGLDNIQTLTAPSGTSKEASLRRLRKDRPDLHAEVLAGRLTAHAAMVQAGFRRKTVSVPVEDPEAIARTLQRNLNPEHLACLVNLLGESTET